jgi:hypothetical protein
MGFYIKDLYIAQASKFKWHDRLTNPPTVPETSPLIKVAALSPQIARVQGGGGGTALPTDENTLFTIPTSITPIVVPDGRLVEADLQMVRENLAVALQAVDAHIEQMQPSAEDLAHVAEVVRG